MANIFDLFKQISKDSGNAAAPMEYIAVGLGNPGIQYGRTRHNAGFMAIDEIAKKYGTQIDRAKFKALVGEVTISGKRVLLMKPQTFMNLSGEAVGEAARFYKLAPERVIVLSDDISLDVGKLRVRRKGSAGGHNGLKSISEHLGTDEYPRIKIGVGQKPHPDYDLASWVLSNFTDRELEDLCGAFPTVISGLEKIVSADIDGAMQICNKK
ncbi:MAG: aminoacyl-tRNA hydrolase [Ruminococcaceae bacterium]|nr:aminoacyl-tRNA hydrolase [Oscillospiraceae bacterium]